MKISGTLPYLPYMAPKGPQTHITEEYVSSPPALIIVDSKGGVWTLGARYYQYPLGPKGEFSFDVLLNGQPTGVIASRIEKRHGKIGVFTVDGWKYWTGASFV